MVKVLKLFIIIFLFEASVFATEVPNPEFKVNINVNISTFMAGFEHDYVRRVVLGPGESKAFSSTGIDGLSYRYVFSLVSDEGSYLSRGNEPLGRTFNLVSQLIIEEYMPGDYDRFLVEGVRSIVQPIDVFFDGNFKIARWISELDRSGSMVQKAESFKNEFPKDLEFYWSARPIGPSPFEIIDSTQEDISNERPRAHTEFIKLDVELAWGGVNSCKEVFIN